MSLFPVHTKESAPEAARQILEAVAGTFGFVPNLLGVMAISPALAEAYVTLSGIFEKKSGLTTIEQQIVLLAVSRYHECHYCVAAHSMIADRHKVPREVTDAIRNDRLISDPKLEALRQLTTSIVETRGRPPENVLQAFINAGYLPSHVFDVLVGIAQKTLSNYSNHLADTPLDSSMEAYTWPPARKGAV
ncbi:MAG: carboxymuconolactone decarboxylase family protein [Gammaproteobacteria bacterium]